MRNIFTSRHSPKLCKTINEIIATNCHRKMIIGPKACESCLSHSLLQKFMSLLNILWIWEDQISKFISSLGSKHYSFCPFLLLKNVSAFVKRLSSSSFNTLNGLLILKSTEPLTESIAKCLINSAKALSSHRDGLASW